MTITPTTSVQSNKETLHWHRDQAYRSMQSTQREWQQSKEVASESVTREGVTLSLSAKVKNRAEVSNHKTESPIDKNNRPSIEVMEMADGFEIAQNKNLSVIMDRVRELSIASSKDTVTEPTRNQMLKEMRQLIDEAEQINKRSRSTLSGYMSNPIQQLKVQKASEAFRVQKELYAIEKS